ncbi:MAG: M20/M25/M40 family metallo-hydrolase, partial [Sediminibacterium sp.]
TNRYLNNIWAVNKYFDASKPTILLNSHHDTVKPNKEYTRDPFEAAIVDDKLFGLGSNDAGGCLVSLIACFLYYYEEQNLKYNLLLAATAEEEISGKNGVEILLPILPPIDFAIVGEPTQLNLAIAERGLLVMDAMVKGSAGHAARNEGDNAIYKAIQDIHWIQQYQFDRVSDFLGPVKITVTSFYTDNKQHNVVPASAEYLLDIRVNELYTFEEVITILQHSLQATLTPRSTRLKSTSIPIQHPIVQSGIALGKTCYGSPTTSDKALMPFPALKMGPGDSARSHTADEFIFVQEIENGIDTYIHLLKPLV